MGGGSGGAGGTGGGTTGVPPRVLTPLSPSSGHYGSALTILGADFGDAGTLRLVSSIGAVTVTSSSLKADAGELWQNDRIVFRYPFPAEGAVFVEGPGGTADAGSFLPSWKPGIAINQDQDDYTPFPSTFLAAPGTVVGTIRYPDPPFVYGGWGVMIHDGVAPRLHHLDVPGSFVMSVLLVPDAGVQPDGVALVTTASPDGGARSGTLYRLVWNAGLPTLVSTGVPARNALGAGYDGTGFFAWAQAPDAGFIRVRPPSWSVDRTLAPPSGFGTGGGQGVVQMFSLAGTLGVQWTVRRNSGFPLFENFEHPEFAFANAAQTAWGPTEVADNEIKGQLDGVNLSISPDGKMSFVSSGGYYDVILQEQNPTYPEVRRATGGFVDAPRLQGGGTFVLHATAADFAGAACDPVAGLRVLRPVPNAQQGGVVPAGSGEIAVWPCPSFAWQVVVDSDGGTMLLVQAYAQKRMFLVKKR